MRPITTFHFGPIRLRRPFDVTTCNLVHRSERSGARVGSFASILACPRHVRGDPGNAGCPVLPVWIDVHRFEARDRKLSCARARCGRRTQRGAADRNRADWFGQCGNYFSRGPDDPSTNTRMWDAGSRQRRRHRILHRVELRRYQGELTGYSFQIRLLSRGTLREQYQHSCVLLLRQLNILQCRADGGIRYRD